MLFFISTPLFAQTGFDKIFSFSPVPSYSVYSGIRNIYSDTQNIYLLGESLKDSTSGNALTNSSTVIASVDYSGNIQWLKRLSFTPPYNSSYPQLFNLLSKVNTNKFVIGSSAFDLSSIQGYYTPRPYLYFFDANGDSIRFVPIPIDNLEEVNYFQALMVDKQKNVITSGAYFNNVDNSDTSGIWLSKFNATGDFLWRKVIFNTPFYYGRSEVHRIIQGIGDSSYIISGYAKPADSAYKSLFTIWKTDTAGNVLWRKSLPKTPNWASEVFYGGNVFFDVVKANNNSGYYFIAIAPIPTPDSSYQLIYYCGKVDENGEMVWAKTYQIDSFHNESSTALVQKPNGDLLFMGQSAGWGSPQAIAKNGASLFCTDSIGNIKWFKQTRRYNCPSPVAHFTYSMALTPQGDIVRGGYIAQNQPQPGCYDTAEAIAWLVLTDSLGQRDPNDTVTIPIIVDSVIFPKEPTDTTTRIQLPNEETPQIKIYPNPTKDKVFLELPGFEGNLSAITILLYDNYGKQIGQSTMKAKKEEIDLSPYAAGLYFIRIKYGGVDIGGQKVIRK